MAHWTCKLKTRESCLPGGMYDAELVKVERKTSKAGNTMAELKFKIHRNGRDWIITDWIVQPKGLWKVEQLAKALGRAEDHKANQFRLSQQVGAMIRVQVNLDNNPSFGWSSKISEYLAADAKPKPVSSGFAPFDFSDPNPPF